MLYLIRATGAPLKPAARSLRSHWRKRGKCNSRVRTRGALGNIFSRYVLREVVTAWVVVTLVLLVILLANEVVSVLERAAANQYPQSVVLELIGLGALQYLSILLPVGLLLGVVLAFGRLYHDSEFTAAFACGAGPRDVYVPVALLAVAAAALLAWLTLVVAPQATAEVLSVRNAALHAGQLAPLAPGKFRTFGGGANAVVYAESVARDGTLGKVFVERNSGPLVEVALAQRARHTVTADGMTHILTLYDGERFEGVPGSAEFRIVRFAEHVVPVQVPPLTDLVRDLEARATASLRQSHDPAARAELHWRLTLPIMCLVLALIAVPLARLRPRQGRYARVWIAVVIFFVYYNLASVGKTWIARGTLPEMFGLWWTHAVVVVLARRGNPRAGSAGAPALPDGPAMSVLDRYIVRAILSSVLLVMLVVLVLGALFVFIDQQDDIGTGHYTALGAFWYTLLNLPQLAYELLPITALIGALLGLGSLARGSELTVIRATGVSIARLAGIALLAGLLLILLEVVLGEFLAPPLQQAAREQKAFSKLSNVSFGGAGAWVRDGDLILNVAGQYSQRQFGSMQIFELTPQHRLMALGHAQRAVAGARGGKWLLSDYTESRFADDAVTTRPPGQRLLASKLTAGFLGLAVEDPKQLTSRALWRLITYFRNNALDAHEYLFAFWSRIARTVAIAFSVLLAIPFVLGSLRSAGAGTRMMLGLAIGIGFFLLQRLIESGTVVFALNPVVLAWLPTTLLALVTTALLARERYGLRSPHVRCAAPAEPAANCGRPSLIDTHGSFSLTHTCICGAKRAASSSVAKATSSSAGRAAWR